MKRWYCINILAILIIASATLSCDNGTICEWPVDSNYHDYSFLFNNESSHTICCTDDLGSLTLQPNQMEAKIRTAKSVDDIIIHCAECGELMNAEHNVLFKGTTKVVFDNKYEITHTDDMPHSLFNVASYSVDISHRQMTEDYTYTFTDEDYDYAVANGVVLGDSAQ